MEQFCRTDLEGFDGAFFYLQCGRADEPPEDASPVEGEDNLYVMKLEGKDRLLFGYAELERSETEAEVEKEGEQDGGIITWTVSYVPWQNPGEDTELTPDTPFELRDTIDGAMHSYVEGSIEIDGSPVKEYALRDDIPADTDSYAVIEETEKGAVLSVGGKKLGAGRALSGTPPEPLEITYKTKLRDVYLLPGNAGNSTVANNVELFAGKDGKFYGLEIRGGQRRRRRRRIEKSKYCGGSDKQHYETAGCSGNYRCSGKGFV